MTLLTVTVWPISAVSTSVKETGIDVVSAVVLVGSINERAVISTTSGARLMVSVLGTKSNTLDWSCTENVKLAALVVVVLLRLLNNKRPALISAALTIAPVATALPFSSKDPAFGRESMRTALIESPISTSLNPNWLKARVVLPVATLIAWFEPVGASFCGVTAIVAVIAVTDSAPVLSLATAVKAFNVPLALAAGVQ